MVTECRSAPDRKKMFCSSHCFPQFPTEPLAKGLFQSTNCLLFSAFLKASLFFPPSVIYLSFSENVLLSQLTLNISDLEKLTNLSYVCLLQNSSLIRDEWVFHSLNSLWLWKAWSLTRERLKQLLIWELTLHMIKKKSSKGDSTVGRDFCFPLDIY